MALGVFFYNSPWEKSNLFQKCHVKVEENIASPVFQWRASKMMTSHSFHVSTKNTGRIAFCWEDWINIVCIHVWICRHMFAEETVTSMYLIQLIFQIGLLIKIDFNILLGKEGFRKKSGFFLAILQLNRGFPVGSGKKSTVRIVTSWCWTLRFAVVFWVKPGILKLQRNRPVGPVGHPSNP